MRGRYQKITARRSPSLPVRLTILLTIVALGIVFVPGVSGAQQIIMALRFDEGAGGTARDTGPTHLVGQITGATWTTGHSGSALQFRGGRQFERGDVLTVAGSATLEFSTPFSVEAWVLSTGAEDYQVIVDKHEYKGGPVAGYSAFAKLDDLQGEVTALRYVGWVQLLGFENAVAREPASPDGSAAPRTLLLPLTMRKVLDRTSVPLIRQCAGGQPLREVMVDLTWKPSNKVRFYRMKLTDVWIAEVDVRGDETHPSPTPLETVRIECRRIEWTYTEVDASGRRVADVAAQWDKGTGQSGQRSAQLPPDADADGIPDEAELDLNLDAGEDDAAFDYDNDGLDNYQEYVAGTNPWAPYSVLKVTGVMAVVHDQVQASLRWKSSQGRVYDILAAQTISGPYRRAATVSAAPGDTTSCELTLNNTSCFFLVKLCEE